MRRQGSACVGKRLRAVIRRRNDGPAVGAEHRDGILDRHRPDESERLTRNVVKDLRFGEIEVQALSESVGQLRINPVPARQPVEVAHPVHLAVAARPDQAKPTAVAQHPTDLRNGPFGIHPVPRRRDEHRIGGRVWKRNRLAAALDNTNALRSCRQHLSHPCIGLDRDDLRHSAYQRAGEQSGPRAHVDSHLATGRHQPVHCLLRRLRPQFVVVLGDRSEGHRALLTISHTRHGSPARSNPAPTTISHAANASQKKTSETVISDRWLSSVAMA